MIGALMYLVPQEYLVADWWPRLMFSYASKHGIVQAAINIACQVERCLNCMVLVRCGTDSKVGIIMHLYMDI